MRASLRTVLLAAVAVLAVLPASAAADNSVVTVSPGHMHGWAFFDDNSGAPGTGNMVNGPGTPPLGDGSAELGVAGPGDRQILATGAYAGAPLNGIKRLTYWTHQTYAATDVVGRHAVALQFDIHYNAGNCDPASATCYQGRLVYEPGVGELNPPIQSGWQRWDALAGHWWASRQTAFAANGRCTQAVPCTWAEVNANWPAAAINVGLLFKVGGGWSAFTGNVDAFTATVAGHGNKTYNFEPRGDNGQGDENGDNGDNSDGGSGGDQGNHDGQSDSND